MAQEVAAPNTIDLSGRVALVTGAGTGIGAACVRRLAQCGADVAIHHHGHADWAGRLAGECRGLGVRAETVQADFAADPGQAAAVVDDTVGRLGRIDVLVNNAAVTDRKEPFETHSRDLWNEILAVNVTAVFLGSQVAANHMIARGEGGRIVNIGSVHARQSAPQRVAYETSKGAIGALTFSAAISLGKHGITVNCIAPGAVVVERYAEFDYDQEWYVSRTPIGRMGQPDDIAALVAFLASDQAGFITGETVFVDGGMTRRMPLVK
ncbi:MAG: SDR family NAD(P)-dependent oxidoreductase [Chloroflexota bacterium]